MKLVFSQHQCYQMAGLIFHIWPFITTKSCQTARKIGQIWFKILSINIKHKKLPTDF